jgi:tripartite-type tricarboxylate transporter receptor subunit TctC
VPVEEPSTASTTDEAGLPGFYASVWFGVWVPKGTPKDVVAKLNGAFVEAFARGAAESRRKGSHIGIA